jgi:hypothetical protein
MITSDGASRRILIFSTALCCGIAMTVHLSTASATAPSASGPKTLSTLITLSAITTPPHANITTAASPVGVSGDWKLAFRDEFNGSSVDTSRWAVLNDWHMNDVTTHSSNVRVAGGNAYLKLESSTSGAAMDSAPYDGAGSNGFLLPEGGYAEARLKMPGNGSEVYNWGAWWVSGPDWPSAGEHDVAEVLGGELTVNYHSSTGSHNQGSVSGYWGDKHHVYGVHRLADHADIYWDGQLVKSYKTDDNGKGQAMILNVGHSDGAQIYGTASEVAVDYVRAWLPQ